MSNNTVIIFGAFGALGRAVNARFTGGSWRSVLVDVAPPGARSSAPNYVTLHGIRSCEDQLKTIELKLRSDGIPVGSVRAIVNVGGGFRMDDASVCLSRQLSVSHRF